MRARDFTEDVAIEILDMFLHKQCSLERTKRHYSPEAVWHAVKMARDRLGQERLNGHRSDVIIIDESERLKGRWIFNNQVQYVDECHCSLCGQVLSTYKGERKNFCPNCGADMRGEE